MNKYLLSVSNDKTVRVWDSSSFAYITKLDEYSEAIFCICSTSSLIAVGSKDSNIYLYSVLKYNKEIFFE